MEGENHHDVHVVMFPWLAQGHMNPFLELAKALHTHAVRISFVSSPLNIARVEKQLSQLQPFPTIDLVELQLPSVEGLPIGVESTADLKNGGTGALLGEALDRSEKCFEELLRRISPDFVIYSTAQCWTPRVAGKLGILAIYFPVLGAASISHFTEEARVRKNPTAEDLTVPPPGFPSSVIRRRLFEARKVLPLFQNRSDSGITFTDRLSISVDESWAIICNSCVELEGLFIDYWQKAAGRPVIPVRVLMAPLPPRPTGDLCLDWLDRQAVRSVAVVSFGSECTLTREEIVTLALGLEESLVPFLCVLLGHDCRSALPQGFEDRTRGRGLVVTEWAPQLHILSHPSAGVLLTHCGWNSVTEGLRFGLPLVALPMQYEQGLTARLVAEVLKVGVEVRRNEEDGCFNKEDISKAVRVVMVGEEGLQIKSNVAEISSLLTRNDCYIHKTNIRNFVSMLKEKASKEHQ